MVSAVKPRKTTMSKNTAHAPKCHNSDNIDVAKESIMSAMRRKGLALGDMYHAIVGLIEKAVDETILRLRSEGRDIRQIARYVHKDDSYVSGVIKAANAKCCKKSKPCKPCKPCKKA